MEENYVLKDVFNERMKRVDDENDRQNHRLNLLEKNGETLNELVISVKEMAISIQQMTKELEKQGTRLDKIEDEPADKWRRFTWLIVTAVAGGVIGWILSRIGM